MFPAARVRTGILVVLLAILVPWGIGSWVKSRKFRPVDMAVSLPVGHVETAEFETNLPGEYRIFFDADYAISYRPVDPCRAAVSGEVRWTLYRLGGGGARKRDLWATNKTSTEDITIIGFKGLPGKYQLEWEIPAEAACLNSGHPRLEISTSSENYEAFDFLVRFLSLFFGGAGVILVLQGSTTFLWGGLAGTRTLRMLPELAIRNVLPARKGNPARRIAPEGHWSIFCLTWVGVAFTGMFALMLLEQPIGQRGLFIQIHQRGGTVSERSPWPKTMSVYVGIDGRYYVNGEPVKLEGLRKKLREELGKQVVWTVYFEADENIPFAMAIYSMDAIQQEGAKVVWITPRIREELNRQAAGDILTPSLTPLSQLPPLVDAPRQK